jgi:hypothetical protein
MNIAIDDDTSAHESRPSLTADNLNKSQDSVLKFGSGGQQASKQESSMVTSVRRWAHASASISLGQGDDIQISNGADDLKAASNDGGGDQITPLVPLRE